MKTNRYQSASAERSDQIGKNRHASNARTGRKILIAYASKSASTQDIAEAIGLTFRQGGASVTVKSVRDSINLNDYDAVVIGSAIQYDRWLPEATDFVARNQKILNTLPVALFFTCLTLSSKSPRALRQGAVYAHNLSAMFPQIESLNVGRFAGVLDYSKLSIGFRLGARILFALLRVKEGDYRDWNAIAAWAASVLPGLNQQGTVNHINPA